MITAAELAEQSGATYRQIDYWCRHDILTPIGGKGQGSGNLRLFDESIIPAVRFLANISRAFNHRFAEGMLRGFYESYQDGHINLGSGIELIWVVE